MTKKSCTIYIICCGEVGFLALPNWFNPKRTLISPYRIDSYTFESKREAKLYSRRLRSALKESNRKFRIYIDDLPF